MSRTRRMYFTPVYQSRIVLENINKQAETQRIIQRLSEHKSLLLKEVARTEKEIRILRKLCWLNIVVAYTIREVTKYQLKRVPQYMRNQNAA